MLWILFSATSTSIMATSVWLFFRRRPWRRWRRNSARWLEDRPVDCVFVRVRTCARSVFVAINPERPPAQPHDYLRLEHFFATPLGGSPRVD